MKATSNLISDLSRALSYILIAYDYKARIYEDDILEYYNPIKSLEAGGFPEDCLNRVRFVDGLLKGYTKTDVSTVYLNRDKADLDNVKKILAQTEMYTLSTLNYQFGEIVVDKKVLTRGITENIEVVLKNEWFPYVIASGVLGLSYFYGLEHVEPILSFLAGAGAKVLSKVNFKEYIPPIQDPNRYSLMSGAGMASFSSQSFNDEYMFLIPKR